MAYVPKGQFSQEFLSAAQRGDRLFHGMLYPGVYPVPIDLEAHQRFLRNEKVHHDSDFFKQCRALVARKVRLEHLWVLPSEQLGYTELDVVAAVRSATAAARISKADVRTISFENVSRLLEPLHDSEAGPLVRLYLEGAESRSPKSSFWRLDTPAVAAAKISIMHYMGNTFDGHQIHEAPVDAGIVEYTDFCQQIYEDHATPVG